MLRTRIIPILLCKGKGLIKGVNFIDHIYVGDAMNAVRIFSNKNADEICVINMGEYDNDFIDTIQLIADESYTPFSVGGGVSTIGQIKMLIKMGAEKVVLNTQAHTNPDIISQAARKLGSQSVCVSIDVRLHGTKHIMYTDHGKTAVPGCPIEFAKLMEHNGAGEILITSIDREGTRLGYDYDITKVIAEAVNIPVVAHGGAGCFGDFRKAIKECGCHAVAAGTLFTFYKDKNVLINYPSGADRDRIFACEPAKDA